MTDRINVRQAVQNLSAYSVNQPPCRVKLNQNENPWTLPSEFQEEMGALCRTLAWNRYPEIDGISLRRDLAKKLKTAPDRIILGNGSNEVLQAVMTALLEPGRRLVITEPTFSLYRHLGRLTGADVVSLPLVDDFQFPVSALAETVSQPDTALTVICSPNNPTGSVISRNDLTRLLKIARGVILVDEAYLDFSIQDFLPLMDAYPQLILTRTFSKAQAFAGIRLGYALARPDMAAQITKALLPFRVSRLTLAAGRLLLNYESWIQKQVRQMIQERNRLLDAFTAMNHMDVWPSQANFLLIRPKEKAIELFNFLIQRSILVRDVSGYPHLDNHLRVTVGTPEENTALLDALNQWRTS